MTPWSLPHPAQVLVVEDNPGIAGFVSLALELEGYQVRVAPNGAEALLAVAADMPDLILLDILMPVMNGLEFAQRFRGQWGRSAPLVLLTSAMDIREQARGIQAEGFLSKPFELDDLLAEVQRQLGHRG